MSNKVILMNALHENEVRVAIVVDGRLMDCDFERPRHKQQKGDIIFAEIKHIEASLDAAFVDIGSPADRHGFLPFKEVAPEYYLNPNAAAAVNTTVYTAQEKSSDSDADSEESDDDNEDDIEKVTIDNRPPMKDVLRENQQVMVQIDKDERGKKGAALTTYISLAGCYLVLMPNNPRAGGISRRVAHEDRSTIREILDQLSIPEGMGIIVRTAGVGRTIEELQWDLNILVKQWDAIKASADSSSTAPYLIHQESDIIIRTIRDGLRPDVSQIIIDHPQMYEKVKKQVELLRPDYAERVKLYSDTVSLFSRYDIEKQIETAFQREVRLPSGGAVVIDHTEALTSIDVNSSRSTSGGDIEETALHTNLEAAQAIAIQLRLRDLGGLLVVDFIDMTPSKNQREVERYFYECLKSDKARTQLGRISRFGLLEMSRQRLRTSLEESSQEMCPRCDGQGLIRSVESLSLSIMRFLEEEAMKPSSAEVRPKIFAHVPTDVATFLLNEKREDLSTIDTKFNVSVLIIPNPNFETPHYVIERVIDHNRLRKKASYKMIKNKELDKTTLANLGEPPSQILVPVVKPEIIAVPQRKVSIFKRIMSTIVGQDDNSNTSISGNKPVTQDTSRGDRSDRQSSGGNNRRGSGQRRQGGDHSNQNRDNRNRDNQNRDNRNRDNQNRDNQNRDNQNRDNQNRDNQNRDNQNRDNRQRDSQPQTDRDNRETPDTGENRGQRTGNRRGGRGGRSRGGNNQRRDNNSNNQHSPSSEAAPSVQQPVDNDNIGNVKAPVDASGNTNTQQATQDNSHDRTRQPNRRGGRGMRHQRRNHNRPNDSNSNDNNNNQNQSSSVPDNFVDND